MSNSYPSTPTEIPLNGVCVVLFNAQGEILLGKRKNGYGPGRYGIPGGRLEPGETLEACGIREVQEETGLTLGSIEYQGVIRENQEWGGDFIHFVFSARDIVDSAQLKEPEKCEGWQWYPLEKLPSGILSGHATAINMVLNHRPLVDLPCYTTPGKK